MVDAMMQLMSLLYDGKGTKMTISSFDLWMSVENLYQESDQNAVLPTCKKALWIIEQI